MRRSISIATILLISAAAFAQSAAETELKTLLTDFLAAASHSPVTQEDKKMFARFFADDVLYTRASGAVVTKADIMKSLDEPTDPKAPKATFSAEDVTVHDYGDTAIVAFRLVQKLDDNGKLERRQFRNTGTFRKRNGQWQAVAWQATRIPEEPAK
jgi:ketosteroid isomerase-like protein